MPSQSVSQSVSHDLVILVTSRHAECDDDVSAHEAKVPLALVLDGVAAADSRLPSPPTCIHLSLSLSESSLRRVAWNVSMWV